LAASRTAALTLNNIVFLRSDKCSIRQLSSLFSRHINHPAVNPHAATKKNNTLNNFIDHGAKYRITSPIPNAVIPIINSRKAWNIMLLTPFGHAYTVSLVSDFASIFEGPSNVASYHTKEQRLHVLAILSG
jgi:hypothetical protein